MGGDRRDRAATATPAGKAGPPRPVAPEPVTPARQAGSPRPSAPEPVTPASRWDEVVGEGPSLAGQGAVDDELAQELALTLVDLLSEYHEPGDLPGTERSSPAAQPRGDDRPPSGFGRPSGTSEGSSGRPLARREGRDVPSARRVDGSGSGLADLLAEAMDAYHSAGPGATPAGERRAGR